MNDIPEQSKAVATRPHTNAVTSAASLYDSDKFAHMQRMAQALQHGTMLPKAVRGEHPQECFSNLLVVFDMAERLRVTPIALAQSVSMVHGKMVLEGKLVQAAIGNVLGVDLFPWWVGERGTDQYRIFLSDKPWDEESTKDLQPGSQFFDRRVVDGSVGEWKTKDNSGGTMPAWTGTQTQNQLLYRGTREWARRFEPSIMLGIYTDDEITAAEERASARAVTQTVSLSALPTGFAKDPEPAEATVEDAVVEDLVEVGLPEDAFQEVLQVASQAAGNGERMPVPDGLSDAQRGTYQGTIQGIIDALPDALPAAEDQQQTDAAKEKADLEADEARKVQEMDTTKDQKPARKPRGQKVKEAAAAKEQDPVEPEGTPQPEDPGHTDGAAEDPPADDRQSDDHDADASNMIGDDDEYPMKANDPACPVDQFVTGLGDMLTWEHIKSGLVSISRTDAWKILPAGDQKTIRQEVWSQMDRLMQAGVIKFDFLNDLSAFRCWLEWYGEEDGILANWDILVSMDHFGALDAESQKALQSAVNARLTELRGGIH